VEKLKEAIQEQQKLVTLELQATGNGYNQALGWVLELIKKSETQTTNSGPTIVASQEK